MNPRLYREVQLIRALPASELEVGLGDRAIAIDYLEHPEGGEMGAVLELSLARAREQFVVTVPVGGDCNADGGGSSGRGLMLMSRRKECVRLFSSEF